MKFLDKKSIECKKKARIPPITAHFLDEDNSLICPSFEDDFRIGSMSNSTIVVPFSMSSVRHLLRTSDLLKAWNFFVS